MPAHFSRCILFALSLILPAAAHAATVKLILPPDLSAPRPDPIRVTGLPPSATITLTTIQQRDRDERFEAAATFRATSAGTVDTARQAPIAGSYAGVEPMGAFWSGCKAKSTSAGAEGPAIGYARVTVRANDREVAAGSIRISFDPIGIRLSTATPFPGAVWAVPADHRHHPVVIVLGGSEGGSSTARAMAPLFAARGYATLGLPYYDPGYDPTDRIEGLPRSFTAIPVDRLATVREWLNRQPEADANRIGLWGASKGAEFALIAASNYSWIKAVVAVVPSDLVWEGWGGTGPATASFAFDGRPLAFEPYAGMDVELTKAAKGELMDLRRVHVEGRAAHPDRVDAARIPIERFHGTLLLIAGGRDQVWPSAEMAKNILAVRKRAHEKTRIIAVPLANHFLGGPGTTPVAPLVTPGSDAVAIAHARADGWAATFDTFDGAL